MSKRASSNIFRSLNKMPIYTVCGILLPFVGTAAGSAGVYLTQKRAADSKSAALSGFAAGVMIAASVWSLIMPAVEMSSSLGFFSFLPMLSGLWLGILFLILAEKPLERLSKSGDSGRLSFLLAVVLHNIPEGMAVGVAFAMALETGSQGLMLSATLLSFGMAMQNIPERAIISLPLSDSGFSKTKAFVFGSLSGIVEPIAALITLAFSTVASLLLPYLLGFAAGAMIYVSAGELIPKAKGLLGVLWICHGFSVIIVLEIALG